MRAIRWRRAALPAAALLLLCAAVAAVWGLTPAPASAQEKSSKDDLELLARTVTGEAQGEPYTGMVAVAAVILNRVDHDAFPKTVAGVIYEPGAFESVSNGLIWARPVDPQARKAAQDALNDWDPTNGAVYFFNPAKTSNRFMWSLPQTLRIGKHVFCIDPNQTAGGG